MKRIILSAYRLAQRTALILLLLCLALAGACGTEHRDVEDEGTDSGEEISAPVPRSPADGAVVDTLSPLIDWHDVPGAVLFQLQVSVSQGFSTSVIDRQIPATSFMISDVTHRPTTLFWRVRAQSSSGLWSGWSSTFSFSFNASVRVNPAPDPSDGRLPSGETGLGAPAEGLTAPEQGATGTGPAARIVRPLSGTVIFMNGYVYFKGAASGEEPLDLLWDFGNGECMEGGLEPPLVRYLESGTYTARLTVTDPHGGRSADEIIIVVVDDEPLPTGPADGYISKSGQTELTWNVIDHAESYCLIIGRNGVWASYPVDGTVYPMHGLAPGRYHWGVQGIDSQGNASRRSPLWSFMIDAGE